MAATLFSFAIFSLFVLLALVMIVTSESKMLTIKEEARKTKIRQFSAGLGVIVSVATYLLLAELSQPEFSRWVMGLVAGVLALGFAVLLTWCWEEGKVAVRQNIETLSKPFGHFK